jgi:hypothetical protein
LRPPQLTALLLEELDQSDGLDLVAPFELPEERPSRRLSAIGFMGIDRPSRPATFSLALSPITY